MSYELLNILSPNNIIVFVLIFTRLSAMLIAAPIFSTYPIPIQIKIWLMATIAFLLLPFIAKNFITLIPTNIPMLIIFMLKEFLIGYLIGLVANLLFIAVQMGAQLISMQSGLAMSNILDPNTGNQSPILAELYSYFFTIVFISLNAHQWMFITLSKSFETLPIGIDFNLKLNILEQILKLSSNIFSIAISIVLPIFCILFVVQVLLGVLAKMIPQMNIFMVAMPFQIIVGLTLVLIFLNPTMSIFEKIIKEFFLKVMSIFIRS